MIFFEKASIIIVKSVIIFLLNNNSWAVDFYCLFLLDNSCCFVSLFFILRLPVFLQEECRKQATDDR